MMAEWQSGVVPNTSTGSDPSTAQEETAPASGTPSPEASEGTKGGRQAQIKLLSKPDSLPPRHQQFE